MPPRYLVLERSLINNQIHEAGAEVEYDGLPSENLKPLDAAGEAKAEEYKASNAKRVSGMMDEAKASPLAGAFDPSKIVQQMADMQAEQAAQNAALMERMATIFAEKLATIHAQQTPVAVADPVVTAPVTEAKAEETETKGKAKATKAGAGDTAAPAGTTDSASA